MKKKSQVQQYFIYIAMAVLVSLIIIYGIKVLKGYEEKKRESILTIFEATIKADIEDTSTRVGSIIQGTYILPAGVDDACFVDLTKKQEILTSNLVNIYPLIKDSIESGSKNNLFLMGNKEIVSAKYIGDICLEQYPYFRCDIVTKEQLNLLLEGKGKDTCTVIKEESEPCFDVELDNDNTTEQRIDIETPNVKLTIPTGTKIDFGSSGHRICIRPINLTSNKSISETYALTPLNTTFDKDVLVTIKYFNELIPSGVDQTKLKINHFNYTNNRWSKLTTSNIDRARKRLTSIIRYLAPVAVFLPEAPIAVISSPSNNQAFYINDIILFNATESFDLDSDPITYNWSFGDNTNSDRVIINHSYTNPGSYNINLAVKDDKNNEDVESVNILIVTRNRHNENMYSNNPVFLISDQETYINMAKLIPLSMWNNNDDIRSYPYLIYHNERATAQDFTAPLSRYTYGEIRVFGNFPSELDGTAISENFDNYLSYWDIDSLDHIVVLSSDNANAALISALFASFLNSPLIFIDNANYNDFTDLISDKRVYIIDTLSSEAYNFIIGNANATTQYTPEQLRTDNSINPYNNLAAEII